MIGFGYTIAKIVENSVQLEKVRKTDLQFGDLVFITTKNSLYSVSVLDDDFYLVYGGWFDRKGLSPKKITITGCTWGGKIINTDILAACGLRLEFGNRVLTTTIQKVCVMRGSSKN